MKISARVENSEGQNHVTLTTNENTQSLSVPSKPSGFGSSANGGELLFLALAACYCNDIYREAAKRNIEVKKVEVEVNGDFGTDGESAKNVTYRAKVHARGAREEIHTLMEDTDKVAEIHNTLRLGTPVTITDMEIVTV